MKIIGLSVESKSVSLSALALAAFTFAPQAARADEAPAAGPAQVEEVVVQARRTSEKLQDIPIAVTAITQQQLTRSGILTSQDLPLLTPGLQTAASPFDSTNIQFKIRGQSTASGALESSVGVYVDGVYRQRTFGLGGALFDLDHVEVLKGPQGTLYGKNTSGGAVSIYTKKPVLDETSGYFDILAGAYSPHNATAARVSGAVNVPLVDGKLAARLSAAYDYSAGYGRDALGRTLMDKHNPFVRGQLLYQPSSDLSVLLAGDYGQFKSNGLINKIVEATPGLASTAANLELGNGPVPGGAGLALLQRDLGISDYYTDSAYRPSYDELTTGGVSLTLNKDLGASYLRSITAYRYLKRKAGNDLDGTPFPLLETSTAEKDSFFSQELNFGGKAFDDKLDYLVGGFYSWFQDDGGAPPGNAILQIFGFSPVHGRPRTVYRHLATTDSYGVFAHAVYNFTDQFNITAGLRYSQDKREYINRDYTLFTDGFKTCNFAAFGAVLANDCAIDFATATKPGFTAQGPVNDDAVSYEFALTYLPTPDLTLYATTRRGFRSGDWNPSGTTPNRFAPESATDYELGVKWRLFERKLMVNVAAYYTDYKDIQKTQVTGPGVTEIKNAAGAKVKGAEFEIRYQPDRNVSLGLNYTYTDAAYKKFEDTFPVVTDYSAEPFDLSKDVVTLDGSWTIPLASGDAIHLNANYAWYSRRYFTSVSHLKTITSDPSLVQPAYGTLNLRFSYDIHAWDAEVAFVGRNVTDEAYWVSGTQLRSVGLVFLTPGEPRFLGVQFVKHF
ncbi:MAG: hypothetical protein JWP35_33 [Caulobacter sp.]|nr:hypothetical protein [Caulobacter sp.]